MHKNKYLVNGFAYLITKNLKPFLDYNFYENFPKIKIIKLNIFKNYIYFLFEKITWKLNKYDVIHINTWENFLNAKKYKNQVLIWESHWFHFGLNFWDTLKHFKWIKKIIAYFVELFLWPLVRYKIKKFDLYYVSTPNMIKHAKKIRYDAKWLPNAIDLDMFCPDWKKAILKWNPVIFCPTRLHSFKNPKFWIDLFFKIKKKYPDATLHLIKYPSWWDSLASYYEKLLSDENTYFWHNFKTKEELSKMYRASDIVLWHFHPTLWMMSLVELEACATWTAVISYDKYEINTSLEELENITFSILWDRNKYNDYVSKNRNIVLNNHKAEYIAKILSKDIDFIKSWFRVEKMSKRKIIDNLEVITNIDFCNFNLVWIRGEKEFLYEMFNKFECSFLIYKDYLVIWYLIWYSFWEFWYINRVAISPEYIWKWLWNIILENFSDNLKYNHWVRIIELVTHKELNIWWFYIKNWYKLLETEIEIIDFLSRKNKLSFKEEYIWEKRKMDIYIKNI